MIIEAPTNPPPRRDSLVWRLLRSPLLTLVLIAGLVGFALLARRAPQDRTATGSDREGCAYLAAETALSERARAVDWPTPTPARIAELCGGDAAIAAGERWDLYWRSAGAPLAVSIDSWDEDHARGDEVAIGVTVINDTANAEHADLRLLAVGVDGAVTASSRLERLEAPARDRVALSLSVRIPNDGPYQLAAELRPRSPELQTVWSRRKIGFAGPGAAVPDPPFENACCATGGG